MPIEAKMERADLKLYNDGTIEEFEDYILQRIP